jgi:quinol monooxygenase YgiN
VVRLTVAFRAPARNAQSLLATLRTLMRATRLEPGCLECRAWTEDDEEHDYCQVHYEERWSSERQIEGRVRSEAFTKLLEVLEAAPEGPDVQFDFVSRQQGLDYVAKVREAGH